MSRFLVIYFNDLNKNINPIKVCCCLSVCHQCTHTYSKVTKVTLDEVSQLVQETTTGRGIQLAPWRVDLEGFHCSLNGFINISLKERRNMQCATQTILFYRLIIRIGVLTLSASWTSAILSSFTGLMTGNVFPLVELTNSLLMKICIMAKKFEQYYRPPKQ